MDYADIYYVDTRNADPRDHRTQVPSGGRPAAILPAGTAASRPVTGPQPMIYGGTSPVMYGPQYGAPYNTPYGTINTPYGAYPMPYPYGQPSVAQSLFGKLTTGQVI